MSNKRLTNEEKALIKSHVAVKAVMPDILDFLKEERELLKRLQVETFGVEGLAEAMELPAGWLPRPTSVGVTVNDRSAASSVACSVTRVTLRFGVTAQTIMYDVTWMSGHYFSGVDTAEAKSRVARAATDGAYTLDPDEIGVSMFPQRIMPSHVVEGNDVRISDALARDVKAYCDRRYARMDELRGLVSRAGVVIHRAKNMAALVAVWPDVEALAMEAIGEHTTSDDLKGLKI